MFTVDQPRAFERHTMTWRLAVNGYHANLHTRSRNGYHANLPRSKQQRNDAYVRQEIRLGSSLLDSTFRFFVDNTNVCGSTGSSKSRATGSMQCNYKMRQAIRKSHSLIGTKIIRQLIQVTRWRQSSQTRIVFPRVTQGLCDGFAVTSFGPGNRAIPLIVRAREPKPASKLVHTMLNEFTRRALAEKVCECSICVCCYRCNPFSYLRWRLDDFLCQSFRHCKLKSS